MKKNETEIEREREKDRKKRREEENKRNKRRRREETRVEGSTWWNGSWKGEVRKDACSPGQRNLYTHAHTRACMQNRKWKKRVEGGKGGKRAKGPPRKPALDRSSGAVGRKLRLKGKWRATGPER